MACPPSVEGRRLLTQNGDWETQVLVSYVWAGGLRSPFTKQGWEEHRVRATFQL